MRIERRHAWWLPITAMHGALLLAALRERPTEPVPSTVRVTSVRVIAATPRRPTSPLATKRAQHSRPWIYSAPRANAPARPEERHHTSGATLESRSQPVAAEAPAAEPPTTDIPVAAATHGTGLLQTEATQRAIREATRQPLLSERAASASQDPGRETTQARLGRHIQQAGTTDCLKGEFLGGGGGLLSLPFWLVAEARGKCQR